MNWGRSISSMAIVAAAIPGCFASANVVTAESVVAALHERKVEVEPKQVQFFVDVPMRDDSSLEVLAVERSKGNRSLVKLRCQQRQACLPFYVAVQWKSSEQQALATQPWQPELRGRTQKSVAPIVIRAGQPATLLISGNQLQMQFQVQCLESGRAGSRIRVRSKDGKKIYRAEVVGPNSVRLNM